MPEAGQSSYTIEVGGDPGLAFSGSLTIINPDGSNASRSVEGTVLASDDVQGATVSMTAQKKGREPGTLRVRILRGGQVVSESETSAEFGVATAVGR